MKKISNFINHNYKYLIGVGLFCFIGGIIGFIIAFKQQEIINLANNKAGLLPPANASSSTIAAGDFIWAIILGLITLAKGINEYKKNKAKSKLQPTSALPMQYTMSLKTTKETKNEKT